jgi:hypothetical protein
LKFMAEEAEPAEEIILVILPEAEPAEPAG